MLSTAVAGEGTPASPRLVRAEALAMLKLAGPLAATQLGQIAINTTDVLLLGWLGPEPLAAASLGLALFFFLFMFGLGVVSATSPLFAQAVGAGRPLRVRRVLQQGFLLVARHLAAADAGHEPGAADPPGAGPGPGPSRHHPPLHPGPALGPAGDAGRGAAALLHDRLRRRPAAAGGNPDRRPAQRRPRLRPDLRRLRPAAAGGAGLRHRLGPGACRHVPDPARLVPALAPLPALHPAAQLPPERAPPARAPGRGPADRRGRRDGDRPLRRQRPADGPDRHGAARGTPGDAADLRHLLHGPARHRLCRHHSGRPGARRRRPRRGTTRGFRRLRPGGGLHAGRGPPLLAGCGADDRPLPRHHVAPRLRPPRRSP